MSEGAVSAIDRIHKPALAGIRVLDFTIAMAGPYCTRLLADVGAEVVKIEALEGDFIRHSAPQRGRHSAFFGQLNCGKRSVVIDLKKPKGVAIARDLASTADVVVESFRPGVMRRLGLGYEMLAAANPRLIYCSISGFGQSGPLADFPAYAPIIHAACGHDLTHLQYQDGHERPANNGIFTADILAGTNAFAAIQTALFERERSGEGQQLDISLVDGMINLLAREVQEAQLPPGPRRHLYTPLRANDGFVIVAPITNKNFEAMSDVVEHPEWKRDVRFAGNTARSANWSTLMSLVEAWTSPRSAHACEAAFLAAGVPCSRYRTVREMLAEPQLEHRGTFSRIGEGPNAFLVSNAPFKMSRTAPAPQPMVPGLGEHTETVLAEVLGFDAQKLNQLREAGVVATVTPKEA